MKFKHEYHYVPKELIINEAIHSAVVHALVQAGGKFRYEYGQYENRKEYGGIHVSDLGNISWVNDYRLVRQPITLQQLFNHEDFKWPEGMDSIGYLPYGSVVFYGAKGYSYISRLDESNKPQYEWRPLNYKPKEITLIATKESQEGSMNKEFTKDMLVAGKHVVRYSDDDSLNLVLQVGERLYLVDLNSDMYSAPLEDSDIKEVYVMEEYSTLDSLRCGHNLKLIWERNEKSPQEIEYESLMNKIAELEAQARKLKP